MLIYALGRFAESGFVIVGITMLLLLLSHGAIDRVMRWKVR